VFQQYRYISARTILGMPKLDRCQSLPKNTWTCGENLWHLVLISHRWGSQNDPDPDGMQLAALKQMMRQIADISVAISDEQIGAEAVRDRLNLIPSFMQQGTLQAAHLVFRILCSEVELPLDEVNRVAGDGILDTIGFWYDYSCLPQDPKTPAEAIEFSQALQGIGDMILLPRVSTLVLRSEGDGYLSRGWCFAESMIASAKQDTNMPMVLLTDRLNQSISLFNTENFLVYQQMVDQLFELWTDTSSSLTTWECFCKIIEVTALALLFKAGQTESEFALNITDTVEIGVPLLNIQMYLAMVGNYLNELDLSVHLASLLPDRGLDCRNRQDYILVALLILKSLVSKDATGDLVIWQNAIGRFTTGRSLILSRHDGVLTWQDKIERDIAPI
jgi:hypothetical protein